MKRLIATPLTSISPSSKWECHDLLCQRLSPEIFLHFCSLHQEDYSKIENLEYSFMRWQIILKLELRFINCFNIWYFIIFNLNFIISVKLKVFVLRRHCYWDVIYYYLQSFFVLLYFTGLITNCWICFHFCCFVCQGIIFNKDRLFM